MLHDFMKVSVSSPQKEPIEILSGMSFHQMKCKSNVHSFLLGGDERFA